VKGNTEILKGAGALAKQEVRKILSKALKVSPLYFSSLQVFHIRLP
jgi:hypothetical protein